jgi:hypothetical protein
MIYIQRRRHSFAGFPRPRPSFFTSISRPGFSLFSHCVSALCCFILVHRLTSYRLVSHISRFRRSFLHCNPISASIVLPLVMSSCFLFCVTRFIQRISRTLSFIRALSLSVVLYVDISWRFPYRYLCLQSTSLDTSHVHNLRRIVVVYLVHSSVYRKTRFHSRVHRRHCIVVFVSRLPPFFTLRPCVDYPTASSSYV